MEKKCKYNIKYCNVVSKSLYFRYMYMYINFRVY